MASAPDDHSRLSSPDISQIEGVFTGEPDGGALLLAKDARIGALGRQCPRVTSRCSAGEFFRCPAPHGLRKPRCAFPALPDAVLQVR
jgi:hypothetical protein